MKIAVFHNFLDNIGGAEIFTLGLARELDADIYTTNIDREKIKLMGYSDITIKSIGKIPINAPWRQQAALWRFRKLNLKDKYDFYIIAGDWAMSGAVNNKPNLWYIQSPIREIWDLYQYTRQNTVPPLFRPAFDIWVIVNRKLNRDYIKHVNRLICNSTNTKRRVKKYLKKNATVIHPSIDTKKFHYMERGDYWLSVNRLISHKQVHLQLEAFRELPNKKLVIVGSYEQSNHFKRYATYCKKIKPRNVKILHWIDEKSLLNLYANCRGVISTAKEEDFGLAPIEAMASGKPVIATNEGGHKETIVNGITGKLIDDISTNKLIEAINEIDKNPTKYKNACINHARKFDSSIFFKKIREEIEKTIKTYEKK